MKFDVVICVSKLHLGCAPKSIRSLSFFLQPHRLLVVTAKSNFAKLRSKLVDVEKVQLLDEDSLIPGIRLCDVQRVMKERTGSSKRANWYFQQFLKMAFSQDRSAPDRYLVWDADTLLLNRLDFLDEQDRVLITKSAEYFQQYFVFTQRVLGFKRLVNHSFISEHMMIDKKYMAELIELFIEKGQSGQTWVEYILRSIDLEYLDSSGFSEFETYGNFIAAYHRDSFRVRSLKTFRDGTIMYGKNPNRFDLFSLMSAGYDYVTFEVYQRTGRKIACWKKLEAFVRFWLRRIICPRDPRIKAAKEICASV